MITNSKNMIRFLKTWGFALLTLIGSANLLSMERIDDVSLNTNRIDDSGLTLVRDYLSNRTSTTQVITNTLNEQNEALQEIYSVMAQIEPTSTLTPQCYISFENKNENATGPINRIVQTINTDRTNLTSGDQITIKATQKGTFTSNSINKNIKNAPKQTEYTFNEPIKDLFPNKPGYYFILKGKDSLDEKTCLNLFKTIAQINQYVKNHQKQDLAKDIYCPLGSFNETNLITFTQNLYNQAKLLRLLYKYDKEFSRNSNLLNLTQKLPQDAKEESLILLQKITTELKKVYVLLSKAQAQETSVSSTLFAELKNLLQQWANACYDIDQTVQRITIHLDNWLPTIKWHRRIEDKSWDDKSNQYSKRALNSNHYANGKTSNDKIRYNPNVWLDQCQGTKKLIWQLYNALDSISVIKNLYINSPLMIDHFLLKYGVKTKADNDSFCYALKGRIYIFLPKNNGEWERVLNKNTNEPFCIERLFTCCINNNIHNNAYEVFHRGITCSDEKVNDIINKCYAENMLAKNDNWFTGKDTQQLMSIISQQSATDKENGFTINQYYANTQNNTGDYMDCFDNYIWNVTDSTITIWMPSMQNRSWAIGIVLDKPIKHNLM